MYTILHIWFHNNIRSKVTIICTWLSLDSVFSRASDFFRFVRVQRSTTFVLYTNSIMELVRCDPKYKRKSVVLIQFVCTIYQCDVPYSQYCILFYKWQCQDERYCMCSISRKTLNTHTHLTEEKNILGDKERQQIRKTKKYWPCANFLRTCLSQHQIQGHWNYCTEILSEWFAVYDQSDSFVLLLQH